MSLCRGSVAELEAGDAGLEQGLGVVHKEKIYIEPSACASFTGPSLAAASSEYIEAFGLADKMKNASHILWATGGSMVPDSEMKLYYERGSQR